MGFEQLQAALIRSALTQYPDKQLYKAAAMLEPEERPTADVRALDPKDLFLFKSRPTAGAVYNPADDPTHPNTIFINKNSHAYKSGKPGLLASVIAHEAEHGRRLKSVGATEGWEEGPAYRKQLSVLERLGMKGDFANTVKSQMDKFEQQEMLAQLKKDK